MLKEKQSNGYLYSWRRDLQLICISLKTLNSLIRLTY